MFEPHETDDSPFIECKCCGCKSVVPQIQEGPANGEFMDIRDQDVYDTSEENAFFTCIVCGDNWTSRKEKDGDVEISFVHQIDMVPALRRKTVVPDEAYIQQVDEEDWEYYLGTNEIRKEEWFEILEDRREEIKSALVN
jgi:hypothetical protein